MRRTDLSITMLVAVCLTASVTFGQSLRRDANGGQQGSRASTHQASNQVSPSQQKREWLRAEMLREFSDTARRAEINAKVDQMSDERIDALAKMYQKRGQEAPGETPAQLAAEEARRQALIQQYQNRLAAARGGAGAVGYAPVITWLPEGTSLGASAVVSPDRRYVRMSLQPFFSSIDRVDTFTFHNGPTRNNYPYYQPYPSYQPNPTYQPQRPSFEQNSNYYNGARIYPKKSTQPQPAQTYHDGLRTRTVYGRP